MAITVLMLMYLYISVYNILPANKQHFSTNRR